MIKLNNKNITYVALADSNNSLKAPKEVWYADSSNSVKLVYRRKDALIEGVDYEKYHWLKGDKSAYIDTDIKVSSNDVISIKFISVALPNIAFVVFGDNSSNWSNTSLAIFHNYTLQLRPSVSNAILTNYALDTIYEIVQTMTSYVVNGQELWHGNSLFAPSNYNCCIFASSTDKTKNFNGKIAYFSISSKINLIPCKLLKPVHKWLDANGIRRQVGECGMIDLISGKFYGNMNSTGGTFTVENYYERKEWLKGDGSAYIDTLKIMDVPSLYIKTTFTALPDTAITESPLFGSRNTGGINGSQIWIYRNKEIRIDAIHNNDSHNGITDINELTIDILANKATINGVDLYSEVSDYSVKNSIYTFRLYDLSVYDRNMYSPYSGKFQEFILRDANTNMDLIPCTLTMDLPASMDSNNIARTKGTSGMWDLVSDRFYGNVANSGTFKAVNLAEGVDYEVHQWLVGEIPIQTSMQSLPINSANFSFTVIFGQKANITILKGETYEYYVYDDNMQKIRVWGYGIGNVYECDVLSNTMIVESTSAELLVNNITIPQYSYPIKYLTFYSASNSPNNTTLRVSKVYVDGIERYIPVKLLKSIPSKYDANGIARQAGECGMYDTVNDIFYGNVVSSGTFSVSDDS